MNYRQYQYLTVTTVGYYQHHYISIDYRQHQVRGIPSIITEGGSQCHRQVTEWAFNTGITERHQNNTTLTNAARITGHQWEGAGV